MKRLQLKVKDLTNPKILTHPEIKNILGGSGSGYGNGKTWVCRNSQPGDTCMYVYLGIRYDGVCLSVYAQPLHCSDFNQGF